MERRIAIKRIGLITGGALLGAGGWKTFQLFKDQDLRLLEEHVAVLDGLADTIIPATDSPGAKDAAVGSFILKMVRDCTERKTRNNFINGFRDLVKRAQSHYGKPFDQCSFQERTTLLAHFEKIGRPYHGVVGKIEYRLTGPSFYTTLKKFTVLGYCTSRQGATQGMRYDYIPGKYVADLPLQPGQRSWSTR